MSTAVHKTFICLGVYVTACAVTGYLMKRKMAYLEKKISKNELVRVDKLLKLDSLVYWGFFFLGGTFVLSFKYALDHRRETTN